MTLEELQAKFLDTGFCPGRLIRGREECDVVYTRLHCEHEPQSHDHYQENPMYNVLVNVSTGEEKKAERAFADWTTKSDAEFIRDVVEWFREGNP